MTTTLYDDLVAAGCEIDSYHSDLYVKVTPLANKILARHPIERSIAKHFKSRLDGLAWIDIPFAYLPWWKARGVDTGSNSEVQS